MNAKIKLDNTGIYKLECNVTGRIYIGATTHLHKRFIEHKSVLRAGKHTPLMQEDFNTYGVGAFSYTVLQKCRADDLNELENYWFKEFSSIEGVEMYNTQPTGCSDYSEERSRKISEGLSGKTNALGNKTENSSSKFYGVSWDKENNKWAVRFSVNGKVNTYGRFTSELEAAKRYNDVVQDLGLNNPLNNI